MRAVVVEPSGTIALSIVPDPVAEPNQVLLRVSAAGVNRADLLQAAGVYPPPPGAPSWPGLEVSGEVVDVGPGVGRWAVGDKAVALLSGGGYAEQVAVRADHLLPVPAGVDPVDAAGLAEAACTAWNNLVDVGRVGPGDWVLIHGGSGGIGTFAIQLAVALGARVLTTAGGPQRCAQCRALGAEVAIDHRAADFVTEVHAATGGAGADVILDVVGAAYLERNLSALADGGRLVVIGMQKGRRAELDINALLSRRATVAGTVLRSRPDSQKSRIVADVERRVWPLLATGRIRPVVAARVPFDRAAQAHELLAGGHAFGKVLLIP